MPARLRRPAPTRLAPVLASAVLGLGALAVLLPPASAAGPGIVVNEVESNGDTADWVELTNTGSDPVDVSGWVLKDSDDTRTFAIVAGTVVPPGGHVAVDVDDETVPEEFGLGGADTIRVFLADGTSLVDAYAWSAHAATTYGRCPDGTGDLRTTTTSTKGAVNDCSSPVRLNEVESSGGDGVLDWVELVNPTSAPVDASGLLLLDSDDSHAPVAVPAGSTIAAGGVLAVDVDTAGGFGLGSADTARLLAADGSTVLDSYGWTTHAATTYGRCPGPTGDFAVTAAPTRGAANDCGFVAPTGVTFNEVESNGDLVGDFAELVNTGSTTADLSGLRFIDNTDNDPLKVYPLPAGTTLAPGARFVVAEADFGFGLGGADSVRLFAPDGVTLLASYSWTAHAATTYGRCPDGTGDFTTTTSSTRGAANDCSAPLRINEVESSGGTPGDWVELVNTGATTLDASGFRVTDSGLPGHTLPAGTTVPAGGLLVVEEAQIGAGLGSADTARLLAPDGSLVDSYSWTSHAATTYGRCPSGTGDLVTTQAPTKGLANACPGDLVVGPWPGGADVTPADVTGALGGDVSGLAYEASGTAAPGVLLAVNNGEGSLQRLLWDGARWAADPAGWAAGRLLRYPTGAGTPDAEGVTLGATGTAAGGVYVATERDNTASSVSRPAVLRYDVSGPAAELTATHEWDLTADLPTVAANAGLEGIAFVPDATLVAGGFLDENTGAAYSPATYPDHAGGLFLVALEGNGRIYAYALDHATGAATRVASFASGLPSVMELHLEAETQQLWVVCDDTCQGRSARFAVATAPGATQGRFAPVDYVERPAGMPNLNNEGFTTTPRAECVAGRKPVFWADDAATGGTALRAGTLACTPPAVQPPTAPPAPPAPVVDRTGPTVRITGVRDGRVYVGAGPRPRCLASDAGSAVVSCTLVTTRSRAANGTLKLRVVASAVDGAGNSTSVQVRYRVKRPR